MKKFDFYQVTGIIAPGMVLILGVLLIFLPERHVTLVNIANISLGTLGVCLILAYVTGQLLQGVGNLLERVWWLLWGGMPTDWVRQARRDLVTSHRRDLIQSRLRTELRDPFFDLSATDQETWYAITRQVYAIVSAAGRSSRADIFNANYGLCRGTAAGFSVLLVCSLVVDCRAGWIAAEMPFIALALIRMHHFGVRYGRELFVQYLQLPETGTTEDKT